MTRFETFPFPHTIIDDFLDADVVRQINAEWPAEHLWHKESGRMTMKWNTQTLPPTARAVVDAFEPRLVELAIGVKGLVADPTLAGGGLHCIPRGGFLNMHYDFNAHPEFGWERMANVLIYLNEGWQDVWRGHLQLGLGEQKKLIAPIAGRCVIFQTNKESWHGHPEPLECPENVQRRSLAMYFYRPAKPKADRHSTVYLDKKKRK